VAIRIPPACSSTEIEDRDEQRGDHELACSGRRRQQRPERHAAERHERQHGELAGPADLQSGEHEQREDA